MTFVFTFVLFRHLSNKNLVVLFLFQFIWLRVQMSFDTLTAECQIMNQASDEKLIVLFIFN
jgi:hypothetical protein